MAQAIEAGIAGIHQQREAQRFALAAASGGFARAGMALHHAAASWHATAAGLATEVERDASRTWMEHVGILRPDLMARSVVPEP
jgi:hypothetical protein